MKTFFLILITISTSSSIRLHCKYVQSQLFGYGCNAIKLKITSEEDRAITEVVGLHWQGKTNNDVVAFSSFGNEIRFMPLGLTNFFPSIKLVEIAQAKMGKISSTDLQQFGDNLSFLFLGENKIKSLQGNLFEFTPKVRWIDLNFNLIKEVERGTFTNLKELYRISFINNFCYNGEAKYVGLKMAIQRIENKCAKIIL